MSEIATINGKQYIINVVLLPTDVLQCTMNDLKHVWVENLPVDEACKREQARNNIITYSIPLMKETLLARAADAHSLQTVNSELQLQLKYSMHGLMVSYQFCLREAISDELANLIILPLWHVAIGLYEENQELADILKRNGTDIPWNKSIRNGFSGGNTSDRFTQGLDIASFLRENHTRKIIKSRLEEITGELANDEADSKTPNKLTTTKNSTQQRTPPKSFMRSRINSRLKTSAGRLLHSASSTLKPSTNKTVLLQQTLLDLQENDEQEQIDSEQTGQHEKAGPSKPRKVRKL